MQRSSFLCDSNRTCCLGSTTICAAGVGDLRHMKQLHGPETVVMSCRVSSVLAPTTSKLVLLLGGSGWGWGDLHCPQSSSMTMGVGGSAGSSPTLLCLLRSRLGFGSGFGSFFSCFFSGFLSGSLLLALSSILPCARKNLNFSAMLYNRHFSSSIQIVNVQSVDGLTCQNQSNSVNFGVSVALGA